MLREIVKRNIYSVVFSYWFLFLVITFRLFTNAYLSGFTTLYHDFLKGVRRQLPYQIGDKIYCAGYFITYRDDRLIVILQGLIH